MITDSDLLDALRKGTLILKLKKLKALGFIAGPLSKLYHIKVTPDGEAEAKLAVRQNR